jgi:hypothetical protein
VISQVVKVKLKLKFNPETGHERPEGEERYSSTLFLITGLDGVEWLMPCPCCFTLGKEIRCQFTGGWVGLRAGMEGCGKSLSHWDSNL